MADNTILNVATTVGDAVRTIDKLGKKTQVVTLDLGGAGAESLIAGTLPVSGSVSVANFPADIALTDTQLRATPVIFTGSRMNSGVSTAAGNNHLTVGGSDGTNLRPISTDTTGKVNVLGAFFQATQPVSIAASVAVTGALTNTEIRATALPVSGTFFQATQPVSNASLPLPTGASTETTLATVNTNLGTDGTTPPAVLGAGTGVRGWLRSIYEKLTTSIAVTGTFFQATQPVSATSLPLPTGASSETTLAALNTKVTAVNTGAVTISTALPAGAAAIGSITNTAFTANAGTNLNTSLLALDSTMTNHTARYQSVTALTTISVANTAVTLTLPAVAGQFHYITRIRITMINTSATAVAGAAAIIAFTSSNLPGALAWSEGTALGAGLSKIVVDEVLENAIKSVTVNTVSTIVAPVAGVGVQVRITAYYYTAA